MIGKSVPRVDAYEKVTGRAKSTSEKMSGGESAACNNWKWNRKIY